MKEGILVIDKPDGITSHDVVDRVRKRFSMRRVGHAGTLDPLATGVLVVLLGKSTKLFDRFVSFDKSYRATMILGTTTHSADTQGKVIEQSDFGHVTRAQVEEVFGRFTGNLRQTPPMVSAVKKKGKKLYELARKGKVVPREPREIRIDRLVLEEFEPPRVQFYLECSKGTYVRQLVDDVGKELGCGACVCQIQRLKVGSFDIKDAVKIEEISERHIRNWQG